MPDIVDNYKSLPPLQHPAGYVYVIRDVEISGCYKIGFTGHPLNRFDVFKRELPFSIEPVLIIKSQDAEGGERRLHRDYARCKKHGEWFQLDHSHLARIRRMSQPSIVFDAEALHFRPKKAKKGLHELTPIPRSEYAVWDKKEGSSYIYVIQEKETRLLRIHWADEPEKINRFGVKIPIWTDVVIAEQVAGFSSILAGDLNRQFKQHRCVGNWLDLNDEELLELRLALARLQSPVSAPTTITPTRKPDLSVYPRRRVTRTIPPRPQRQIQNVPAIQPQARKNSAAGWRNKFIIVVVLAGIYFVVAQGRLDPIMSLIQPPTATPTQHPTTTPTQHPTALPTATSTPQPTVPPTATSTPQPTATPTQHPTASPTATFTTTPPPSPTATEIALYYVDTASAYVRACPSTACQAVGGLSAGDIIQVLGQVSGERPTGFASDVWSQFEFQGDVAYIHSALLSKGNSRSDQ